MDRAKPLLEIIGIWCVTDLNFRTKSINNYINYALVFPLELFTCMCDQINQKADLNFRAMLGINELAQSLNKMSFIFENVHKLSKNQVLLLLIAQKKQSNPFLNRLRIHWLQTNFWRINDIVTNHQLIQACSNLQFFQIMAFHIMMFFQNIA